MSKITILGCICFLIIDYSPGSAEETRVRAGLQALFEFSDLQGTSILDRSQMRRPIELRIETPKTAKVRDQSLQFEGKAFVRSRQRAVKIHQLCSWTNELTVEVWIQPDNAKQSGPARIISFSRDGNQRNFTLGQDGNKYDFRLRTNRTSDNGIPSLSTKPGTVTTKLTHVVYSRDRGGAAKIYLNGKLVSSALVPGDFSNWDINFRLILGNEHSGDRVWKGKLHLAAIYNRALNEAEISRNYRAGHRGPTTALGSINPHRPDPFKNSVAPILANHCLECHDASTHQGGLDLSTRDKAFQGGDSGEAIVKGKSHESLMWEQIASDDMPADRSPLNASEKKIIKQWIDDGADWSIAKVDSAVFLRAREVDRQLVRRLTVPEYVASVKMAVGVDIEKAARQLLPKDLRTDGFENTAYNLNVDLKHIQVYAELASQIVEQVNLPEFTKRFGGRKKLDDKNLRDMVARMGRWILRGPLEEFEVVSFTNIARSIRDAGGSFEEALAYVMESMLQSPRFIYQMEPQRGDGNNWPVEGFVLANRLSFLVWGSPPDQELFDLAVTGRISDSAVYESQIDRLLNHPRALERSKQFASQWLHLSRLDHLKPDLKKYPDWDPQLANDMKLETLRFWEERVWNEKAPLVSIFDADFTFVTSRLAKHYGLQPSRPLKPGLQKVSLTNAPGRMGILTHGSILTVGGDEASMVSRGLFVLDDVLRGVVKDPPACVDTTPIPTKAGLTQRSIALSRIANQNCGGCHSKFEPLAFGLERFDGLGSYHEHDKHGNRLREDGEILFPGASKSVKFRSSKELAKLVANSERVHETIAWKLTQFSIGRPLGPDDLETLTMIVSQSKKNGGTWSGFIKAILTSDLIMKNTTEPYPKEAR